MSSQGSHGVADYLWASLRGVLQFAIRFAVGFLFAAVLAAAFSLAVDSRVGLERLGVALLVVGVFAFMMAFAGHSHTLRHGLQDAYFASAFPDISRRFGDSHAGVRVSDSFLFGCVGLALILLGGVLA